MVARGIPTTTSASQVVRIIMATMMVLGSRIVTMRAIDINGLTRIFHQIDGLHSLQIFLPLLPSQYQLSQTHGPPPPPLQFPYHNLYLCLLIIFSGLGSVIPTLSLFDSLIVVASLVIPSRPSSLPNTSDQSTPGLDLFVDLSTYSLPQQTQSITSIVPSTPRQHHIILCS